jgi:hypothetical protein
MDTTWTKNINLPEWFSGEKYIIKVIWTLVELNQNTECFFNAILIWTYCPVDFLFNLKLPTFISFIDSFHDYCRVYRMHNSNAHEKMYCKKINSWNFLINMCGLCMLFINAEVACRLMSIDILLLILFFHTDNFVGKWTVF